MMLKFKVKVKFETIDDSVQVVEKRFLEKERTFYYFKNTPQYSDEERMEKAKNMYNRLRYSKTYETLGEVLSRVWRKLKQGSFNFYEGWSKPGKIYEQVKDSFIPPIKEWIIGILPKKREKFFFLTKKHSHIFHLHSSDICWKDKFGTPRFEQCGECYLILFGIFYIGYILHSPSILKEDWFEDDYWEQVLWTAKYSDGDLEKAKSTWPWKDESGNSNWIASYERHN